MVPIRLSTRLSFTTVILAFGNELSSDNSGLSFNDHVAINLSISSNCNKSNKIRLIAICHLRACYNLLKQL